MKKFYYIVLLPYMFLNSINTSLGSTASGSMAVSATVQTTCTLSVPGSVAFGNYTLTAISVNAGNIVVTCTQGTSYTLAVDKGAGSGASTTGRKMTISGGTATLNYALKDASGANGGNIASYTASGTGSAINYPVFGYIGANEPAPVGSYSDTVNVTLTY